QAQSPIVVLWKFRQHNNSNGAGADGTAARIPPGPVAGIEPLRTVSTVQPGAPNLAAGAAFFEIHQEDALVRRAGSIGPALVASQYRGLVRGNQIRVRLQFLVALADREREVAEMPHLAGRSPLKRVPHLDRSGRLNVGPPDALRAIDVPGETARQ